MRLFQHQWFSRSTLRQVSISARASIDLAYDDWTQRAIVHPRSYAEDPGLGGDGAVLFEAEGPWRGNRLTIEVARDLDRDQAVARKCRAEFKR